MKRRSGRTRRGEAEEGQQGRGPADPDVHGGSAEAPAIAVEGMDRQTAAEIKRVLRRAK